MQRTCKLRDLALKLSFHIPSVIRYLGQDYMGDHLPRSNLLQKLKPLIAQELFININRVLHQGSPAKLFGYSSHAKFMEYKRYGNHASVNKDVQRTLVSLNKEERNPFALAFPNWLARFIPHLHLTPRGLVTIPGKKDRLIFDDSFAIQPTSEYVNKWTSKQNEPPLVFPVALTNHLKRIYNIRIA